MHATALKLQMPDCNTERRGNFLRCPLLWVYVVAAAASCTIATAALSGLFRNRRPYLTAPFIVIALTFVLATDRFGALHSTGLLPAAELPKDMAAIIGVVDSRTLIDGMLVAWRMGATEQSIQLGLFGYNSVLTAVALASFFLVLDWTSALYILLAASVTAVMFASVSAALLPIGMPALTAPFVLVTWAFLFAAPSFKRLKVR